jgi:hypothetical protein
MNIIKIPINGCSPEQKVLNLNDSYPFRNPDYVVGQKIYCVHCCSSFLAENVAVDASDGLLVCPNGNCDGNPFDWSTEPWC